MKIDNKQKIEIVGILAVVISLALVAIELRETRLSARAASYQEIGIALADVWASLALDEELSVIAYKAGSSDPEEFASLSEAEVNRANSLLISWLRIYEVLYLQVQEGLLDEDSLRYLGYGDLLYGRPFFQNLWPTAKVSVTPEFADYLEDQAGI